MEEYSKPQGTSPWDYESMANEMSYIGPLGIAANGIYTFIEGGDFKGVFVAG